MRLLGELKDKEQATLFSSYLLVKGIDSHFDHDAGDPCEVWVKDEDQFKEAYLDFQEFVENPGDQKYSNSVRQAKIIARAEEKKRQQIQKRIVKVQSNNMKRRPPLTVALIVISGLVALLTSFGDIGPEPNQVRHDHPVYRILQFNCIGPPEGLVWAKRRVSNPNDLEMRLASIKRGQIWRLFTTIFIHLGVFHLVFNMIWLFQFGTLIENRYGTLFFAILVFTTAAISGLFQDCVPDWMDGSVPGFVSETGYFISGGGGMSGVIYGLFGFIWMKSIYDSRSGFRLPQSTIVILIGWLFFCMIPVDIRAGIGFGTAIGNWAHGIGLLVGMAFGYLGSR